MEVKPIWADYATFDEKTGYVNGVRDDAPPEAKEAYRKEQERREWYIKHNIPMPK